METVVMSNARPSALLLEHAFGRRLMDGEDEWRGVDSVVRSSFLLLYREFRRQDKRLRVLEANQKAPLTQKKPTQDDRSALLNEQLQLLNEELQLLKTEIRELRSTETPCKCRYEESKATLGLPIVMTQVAVQARRQWHRHQKLRLKVSKIQRQARAMRRVQHECEEIVVRTAEKHQRHMQGLNRKIHSEELKRTRLEDDVETRVKPRLKLLEKHVVVMHRKLKLVAKGPADRQDEVEKEEKKAATVSDNRQSMKDDRAWTRASQDAGNQDVGSIRRPVEARRRHLEDVEDDEHEEDDDGEVLDYEPVISSPRGHATLRLRYQHERKRQIRRLDRLRHSKTPPRVLPASKHEERSVVG